MYRTAESIRGASTAVTSTATRAETQDDLFARELENKLGTGEKGASVSVDAILERLAAAFPSAYISTRGAADSGETEKRRGTVDAMTSIDVKAEMLAQMGESEDIFETVRARIAELLGVSDGNRLINAGDATARRRVSVDSMEIRYIETQWSKDGTQLSATSLIMQTERMVSDTLDKLIGSRTDSGKTAVTSPLTGGQGAESANAGFDSLLTGGAWRMQSFVSMELLVQVQGAFSAGGSEEGGFSFAAYMQLMGLVDPLVLDLGGGGINLRSAEEGVYFDMEGSGSQVQTGFIQGNTAFLYLDANGNGVVDDVGELFGDYGGFANGFEKLAQYDDNGDGVIDERDAIYHQLRLWRDLNGDGVNQEDESMTLAQAGIQSLDLNYLRRYEEDGKGNVIGERSSFTRLDGSRGEMADVWLSTKKK